MNLGSTASLGSVTDQSEQGFSISDPVAYYKMDENVGTSSTADTAAGLNNGTMSNFVTTDWRIGKFGSALNFNATTSSINAGSATGIDNLPASGMAISAWIFPNSQGEGSAGFIVAKNAGTTPSAGWILQIAGTNALTFTVDGSTDLVRTTSNSVLTTGAWNHVVVSWDGVITTASSVNIYVNGSVVTYATTTNGASRVADGASSMYIGNDSTGARTFDGLIDELKIFSGALTLPQVEYLYNGGQPTVWYKLDECTGNTAYNSAVNANNIASGNNGTIYPVSSGNTTVGTCSSGVTTDMWNDGTTGKFNSALGFDGIDDYVDLGDLTFTESASQLTWSFWVKGNTWDTSTVLLAKSDLAGTQIGWSFAVSTIASHRLVITIPTTVTDGTTYGYLDNIFTDTSWIHITAVFDGTLSGNDNRLKMFVNGKQVVLQFSGTIPANTTATTSNAVIGGISGGTNYSLDGLIDDVRIYNYALSTSQVQKAYNQGASVRFGPETGNP
jgi:hypothetical protein